MGNGRLRVLSWHVHGSWQHSFVQGHHDYLLPVLPERGPWGTGRAGRPWPDNVVDVEASRLRDMDIDVAVLQRPEELGLVEHWLGRVPGDELPAVYVEHHTPGEHAANTRHPLADQRRIPIVHVTAFNRIMWDCGDAPTTVVPHGVVDPGARYTGQVPRAAAVINEPVRRGRVTGTDLLSDFAVDLPVDVYGIGAAALHAPPEEGRCEITGGPDLPMHQLHDAMAQRRVYLHTARWTSLGLSLLEAMHLGMPVVVVAATAAAVFPPEIGAVSSDVDVLRGRVRTFLSDRDEAAAAGTAAREYALRHFGIDAFLQRWEAVLAKAVTSKDGP
jgi:glycosyltransferase involved in cell wall biosynthesis